MKVVNQVSLAQKEMCASGEKKFCLDVWVGFWFYKEGREEGRNDRIRSMDEIDFAFSVSLVEMVMLLFTKYEKVANEWIKNEDSWIMWGGERFGCLRRRGEMGGFWGGFSMGKGFCE